LPPLLWNIAAAMPGRPLLVALLAFASAPPALAAVLVRQPATARGAVEASEKLEPKATPHGKVVELLKDLIKKVEEEGKRDAAAYDKYACFCKEQADQKLYQNDTSTKKVEGLSAEIGELDADIAALAGEISELSGTIAAREAKIAERTEAREAEHQRHLEKSADIVSAIDACSRAIEALKESKSAMEGKAELEALAQVRQAASRVSAFVSLTALQASSLDTLAEKGGQPGQAYTSSYHSNEIIETLEGLKDAFIDQKNSQDKDEFEANKIFEQERLGLQNDAKFAQMDKDQKEEVSSKKAAQLAEATKERDLEESSRVSDMEFLSVLTTECQEKAEVWHQNSDTRAGELKALQEAIDVIEGRFVQKGETSPRAKTARPEDRGRQDAEGREYERTRGPEEQKTMGPGGQRTRGPGSQQTRGPPAFLQLLRGRGGEAHQREKLLKFLDGAAKRLKSPVLMMAALKARAAKEDHFVKVRGLLKDLIKRLGEQALAESSHKEFCDQRAKAAVSDRDDAQSTKEENDKQISIEDTQVKTLTDDIAKLSAEIAGNSKGLLEATELREGEKANNDQVVADSQLSMERIEQAIEILHKFYDNALVQKGVRKFVPKESDREGNTVGDLAPDDAFHEEYHGQQDASKGIFGLLEVLKSDFEKQVSATQDSEETAQGEFDTFKTANEKDTGNKDESKDTKDTMVTESKEELIDLIGSRKEAVASYDIAVEELQKVRNMCVDTDETYEERTANREQEIEALRQAHDILEDWQSQ